jgi:uncharacterized iron-regulated protein
MIRTPQWKFTTLLLPALLLLWGCATEQPPGSASRWKSPLYQNHPLAGEIWKPAEHRLATAGEVYAEMKKADFVLIGEKHDNPDHHWIQAKLISEIGAYERRAAVVFEMLTTSQQKPLDDYLSTHPGDAAGIGAAVGWEQSGWPDWRMYQPIAQQALYNHMPLLAGGLDREMLSKIVRDGPDALGKARARALKLDQPIAKKKRADMRQVIFESHCKQLPEPMLDPMVTVTLAKDATMAARMIEARRSMKLDVAVLIAGSGHVRNDWGVPIHLRQLAPGKRIVAVGMAEVEKGITDPAEYTDRYGDALPFDYVWFTPRVDDEDPCKVFAEQLKAIREKHRGSEGMNGK